MLTFIIPLLIILGIVLFPTAGDIVKNFDISFLKLDFGFGFGEKTKSNKETTQQKKKDKKQQPPQTYLKPSPPPPSQPPSQKPSPPPFSLDTFITAGPKEGEVFSETNTVLFEFSGSVAPKDKIANLTFETKIEGFDEDWQTTSSPRREAILAPGPKEYTFFVRAKGDGVADPTPASRTFRINTSPFFQKIKIASFDPTKDFQPFTMRLRTYLNTQEKLNLSGWTMQSRWQGSFQIPLGIERFHPALTTENNNLLWIHPSDTIQISGGPSPLGGNKNFKPNKCFAHLKQFYPLLPGPSSCSFRKPSLQEISQLQPLCQEFILQKINYSSCQPPDFQNPLFFNDSVCALYINKLSQGLSYDACYQAHSRDQDFTESTWYIYANRTFGHSLHDVIELVDQQGLLVDRHIY